MFTEGNHYYEIFGEKLLNGSEMLQNKIIMWFDNSLGDKCLFPNVSKSSHLARLYEVQGELLYHVRVRICVTLR